MRTGAFTMIEMLAVTALSAVLMVGLLGVVSTMRIEPAVQRPQNDAWLTALVDQLHWDLTHAQQIQKINDSLTLVGYGHLDRVQTQPGKRLGYPPMTHRPVHVAYAIVTDSDRRWLIREQTRLNDLTNQNTSRHLVAEGILAVDLWPDSEQGVIDSANDSWLEQPTAVPNRVRLVIHWRDDRTGTRHEMERLLVIQ